MFHPPHKWIVASEVTREQINSLFGDLDVMVDSNVMVIVKKTDATYDVFSIYKVAPNTGLIFERSGVWNKNSGYVQLGDDVTAVRRKNLTGSTIRTALVITHNDSLNHLLDKR